MAWEGPGFTRDVIDGQYLSPWTGDWVGTNVEEDMLGIAMTNTAALGVPTFGRQVMFGTNPLAFAAPADRERAFVLDMSTTVVTRGKLEVYDRMGKPLPEGWAVDKRGKAARDPQALLDDMFKSFKLPS